jgi:hypothetical protein
MKFWAGQMVRGEMRDQANMPHDARHIGYAIAGHPANARAPRALCGIVQRRKRGARA